jgi:hypothetical protein
MDTPDLAVLVPELMARHTGWRWILLSGRASGEDLVVELYPLARPERVATVRVNAGAEVFSFVFAGHESRDFAYTDDDRRETLRARIDLAMEAACGPTRVIREHAGGATIKSTLVVDPDGPSPRQEVASYPIRRVKAFLTGSHIIREVTDFPAGPPPRD